jgi:mannose-6-phosphate isomerase-like protein (cupin superfamily)
MPLFRRREDDWGATEFSGWGELGSITEVPIAEGQSLEVMHADHAERWQLLDGEVDVAVEGKTHTLRAGEALVTRPGVTYTLTARSASRFFCTPTIADEPRG